MAGSTFLFPLLPTTYLLFYEFFVQECNYFIMEVCYILIQPCAYDGQIYELCGGNYELYMYLFRCWKWSMVGLPNLQYIHNNTDSRFLLHLAWSTHGRVCVYIYRCMIQSTHVTHMYICEAFSLVKSVLSVWTLPSLTAFKLEDCSGCVQLNQLLYINAVLLRDITTSVSLKIKLRAGIHIYNIHGLEPLSSQVMLL